MRVPGHPPPPLLGPSTPGSRPVSRSTYPPPTRQPGCGFSKPSWQRCRCGSNRAVAAPGWCCCLRERPGRARRFWPGCKLSGSARQLRSFCNAGAASRPWHSLPRSQRVAGVHEQRCAQLQGSVFLCRVARRRGGGPVLQPSQSELPLLPWGWSPHTAELYSRCVAPLLAVLDPAGATLPTESH